MRHLTKWLTPVLVVTFVAHSARAQLTLEEANSLARNNYPAIRQKELVAKTADLNISNITRNFLPQLTFNAQGSYQSQVTSVEVPIPGVKIPAPEKDQYKITADINQLVFDGGATREQKKLQQLNAEVEGQQVEVELYKIRERINQLFLGVLYLDEQLKQLSLVRRDLETGLKKVEAQLRNGTAFRSNADILRAELLKTDQRAIELKSGRWSLMQTLGLFINRSLDSTEQLQRPSPAGTGDTTIRRPEITLFANQQQLLEQQNNLIRARNLPKTSLFLQGGYGRPGLNMLKNEFDLFYIGGVRLNWSLSNLYTARNDKKIVRINQQLVDVKRDAFLMNTRADLINQHGEIRKLSQLIASDKEIIELRKSVSSASQAQLENGVITASDYLREINAEDMARQTLITHELQLLQAQIGLATLLGK